MRASELVERSLRLINVPGRGASLSAEDQDSAFTALQEILDSKAVSKQFVPGIRRHFFPLQTGKAVYSYGSGSGNDFRSDDFDDDPPPIRIEDAYLRSGATIINNEIAENYRFEAKPGWIVSDAATVALGKLNLTNVSAGSQYLVKMESGKTYRLVADVEVFSGSCRVAFQQNFIDLFNIEIDTTGEFQLDFTFSGIAPIIGLGTTTAGDDCAIKQCSIIEVGLDRLELPEGVGTDTHVSVIGQKRHNRQASKGTSGQPGTLLYSRGYPSSEIRLDCASSAGDILIMDVLTNRVSVSSLESTIRLNPEALLWLRYKLADHVSAEYGKGLSQRQLQIMNEAWNDLASGSRRKNPLEVDRGLTGSRSFNINRGD